VVESNTATSQSSTGQAAAQPVAPTSAVSPAGSGSSVSPQTQTSQPSSASTGPTRPEYLPEAFWDAANGIRHKEFGEHYSQLTTRLAAEDIRRNTLPKTIEEVKLDLPKDFVLPQGVEFKLDSTKPEFNKFREIAIKRGLDADTVTDIMGVYAETVVGSEASYKAAQKVELDKLGANAAARVTALDTFFTGILGADDAKHVRSGMYSAGIVTALEKLATKFANQGAASFRQDGREPGGQPGRASEAEYNAMTSAQRWDYARSFDQKQFQNGAAR
jgi:hypothetical protein